MKQEEVRESDSSNKTNQIKIIKIQKIKGSEIKQTYFVSFFIIFLVDL